MAKKKKSAKGKKRSGGLGQADGGTILRATVGGYSPNKKGGHSVSFTTPIAQIQPNKARDLLVGAQLRVVLECDPNASRDVSGQERLGDLGDGDFGPITFIATCEGIGINTQRTKFSLAAPTVGAEEIAPFAFKEAKVRLVRVGDRAAAPSGKPKEVHDPDQQTFE